ncbi:hypothetical protein APHAL10511_002397 [Amanita phalloides]|nr:hypothetical protein APHAL10511_002397 [Amanita phalloides]
MLGKPDPHNKLKHVQTLSYLFSKGMPADVPDIVGCTALHHVLTTIGVAPELDIEFVRILIEDGKANVDYQNRYGEVPIFVAMKRNFVDGIQMLLEHGASMDVEEADGITPESFYVSCGPQVTAMVARYCSKECQKQHWPTHKATCKPFNASSTITVKPYYMSNAYATLCQTATTALGEDVHPSTSSKQKQKSVFQPGSSFPTKVSAESPKSIIIKVQVPFDSVGRGPAAGSKAAMLVYTKKRDLTCQIQWEDNKDAYDRLSQVVREKGVKGTKAYFAAELRGKDELVIKVSEVLAEQPW